MVVINLFFLLVRRRNSVFVNCNVFLNKYSLQSIVYSLQSTEVASDYKLSFQVSKKSQGKRNCHRNQIRDAIAFLAKDNICSPLTKLKGATDYL